MTSTISHWSRVRLVTVLGVLALVATACGPSSSSSPASPGKPASGPPPDPTAVADGQALIAQKGCGGCHTFTPAGSSAMIGPDLDKLADYATKAKQPLAQFTETSITDPGAYVEPGFPKGVMPATFGTSLSKTQLADLVAFLDSK